MAREGTPLEEADLRLREAGLKATPQRRAVLLALWASDDHPDVERIWQRVRTRLPRVSLATVYNTLKALQERGLADRLPLLGPGRYDRRTDPHGHLICEGCGVIQDVLGMALHDETARLMGETGYRITGERLEFYGLCPHCQASAGTPTPAG